jgi:hypothetical protein
MKAGLPPLLAGAMRDAGAEVVREHADRRRDGVGAAVERHLPRARADLAGHDDPHRHRVRERQASRSA